MALVLTDPFHCFSVPQNPVSEVSPSITLFYVTLSLSCFVDSGERGISKVREKELLSLK